MKNQTIRIYDNGGKTTDRYTVVHMGRPERMSGSFEALGMDENPFHPQGIGQHTTAMPGRHLGRRIEFEDLPAPCQVFLVQAYGCDDVAIKE